MLRKLFGFGKKKEKELEQEVETAVEDQGKSEEVKDETHESQEKEQHQEQEAENEEIQDQEEIQDEEIQDQEIQDEEIQDQDQTKNQIEETANQETQTQQNIQEQEVEIEQELEDDESDESDESEEAESEVELEAEVQAEEFEQEAEIQEIEEIEEESVEKPSSKGFFSRLKEGLSKTTQNFTSKLDNLFKGYKTIDAEIYEDLEEILITADVGFETTLKITEELKRRERENKIEEVEKLQEELEKIIEEILVQTTNEEEITSDDVKEAKKQKIMVIVGVNGVGKTTSIGKLAFQLKNEGNKVMLAAADTFRAAATEQLVIWAQRADVPIIKHGEGADPSAVIFDAIKSAKAQNVDILICDTAGRLHNKKNLMNELEKVFKIINREFPESEKEVLLVIDATTGQNAINQAKVFKEASPLTGLILTKLDGTAKGGVVLGIISELSLPIKYIGVGEKIEDLQMFDAKSFAKALFGKNI